VIARFGTETPIPEDAYAEAVVEIKNERISFDGGGSWLTLVDIDEPPGQEPASFVLEAIWLLILMLVAVVFTLKLHHLEWSPIAIGLLLVVAAVYFATKNARHRAANRVADATYKKYKADLEWRTEQITIHSTIPRLLNTSRGLIQLSDECYQLYIDAGSPGYAMYSLLAPKHTAR
jgi:hypothetical protein